MSDVSVHLGRYMKTYADGGEEQPTKRMCYIRRSVCVATVCAQDSTVGIDTLKRLQDGFFG